MSYIAPITIEFIDNSDQHIYEDDRRSTLHHILANAEAIVQADLGQRLAQGRLKNDTWAGRTIKVQVIGVRGIREEELAKLIIAGLSPDANGKNSPIRPYLFLISENSIHDWDAHRDTKRKQFFIQMAVSFGLGRVVPYSQLREFLTLFVDRLLRCLSEDTTGEVSRLRPFPTSVDPVSVNVRDHICQVLNTFHGGLQSLFRLTDDRKREEVYARFGLQPYAHPGNVLTEQDACSFLKLLARVYRVGRYRRAGFEARVELVETWPDCPPLGSSALLRRLREDLLDGIRSQNSGDPQRQSPESNLQALRSYESLRVYYLLRDCARTMASGASLWPVLAPGQRRRILLIDDNYRDDINWRLDVLQKALWLERVDIDVATSGLWVEFSEWFETNWASQNNAWTPNGANLKVRKMPSFEPTGRHGHDEETSLELGEYDVILLDVEVEGRDRGPELIYFLSMLSACNKSLTGRPPRLIVLTDARANENLQQCLNLGAESHLAKERIFDLPFFLTQFREKRSVTGRPGGVIQLRSLQADLDEPRAVHNLPVRAFSGLDSASEGMLIEGLPSNYLDRKWVQRLPKADLHYHIGTSISLETVAAMALNTVWYLLKHSLRQTKELIENFYRALCIAAELPKSQDPAARFWTACVRAEIVRPEDQTDEDLLGVILKACAKDDKLLRPFEVSSLLVAVIVLSGKRGVPPSDRWCWIEDLGRIGEEEDKAVPAALKAFYMELWSVLRKWTTFDSAPDVRGLFNYKPEVMMLPSEHDLAEVGTKLRRRSSEAAEEIERVIKEYENSPTTPKANAGREFPTLASLVEVPKTDQRSLLRYLWGASLLGADHLQYPENLLLAAMDIVRQNVLDNVWYSELRCATTGYCAAGMTPEGATNLLCRALDVGSAHWAPRVQQPVDTSQCPTRRKAPQAP